MRRLLPLLALLAPPALAQALTPAEPAQIDATRHRRAARHRRALGLDRGRARRQARARQGVWQAMRDAAAAADATAALSDRVDLEAVHRRRDPAARGRGQAEPRRHVSPNTSPASPAATDHDPPVAQPYRRACRITGRRITASRRWRRPVTPQQIVDRWAKKPLDFAPGTQWQYSNTGYVVAGMIVEKVVGRAAARVSPAAASSARSASRAIDQDHGDRPGLSAGLWPLRARAGARRDARGAWLALSRRANCR